MVVGALTDGNNRYALDLLRIWSKWFYPIRELVRGSKQWKEFAYSRLAIRS